MHTKTTLTVRLVTRVTRVSRVDSPKTLSVSASRRNRLFLSSPYLCVNKVSMCDLLRARFRISESWSPNNHILTIPFRMMIVQFCPYCQVWKKVK